MKRVSPWIAFAVALWLGAVAIQTVRAPHWGYFSVQMTEWLINYQAGFVRRGLPGEVFFRLQALSGLRANWLAIATSLVVYGVLVLWLARHAASRFGWPLLASSVLLGASAFHGFVIRKDALVIVGLIACLAIDRRAELSIAIRFLLRNAVAVVVLLSHEMFAFIALPALMVIRTRAVGRWAVLEYLPALFALAAVVHWHGDSTTAYGINDSLRDLWRAIDPSACCFERPSGSIAWLGLDSARAFQASTNALTGGRNGSPLVAVAWLFTALLCGFFVISSRRDGQPDERARLAVTVLVQFFFVAPLAIIGSDTGRWIVLWTLSSVVLHVHGFAELGWPRRMADRCAATIAWRRLMRIEYDPRWLLVFGVPGCCWSFSNYLSASPIGFYVNGVWLYFVGGLRW